MIKKLCFEYIFTLSLKIYFSITTTFRTKVHSNSSLSTFLTMKVQFYSPSSTIFICECPVLLTNLHFFSSTNVQSYSPMSTFPTPKVQFLHFNTKTQNKDFPLFRVRIFLSFCKFYKFSSILNLYFPFP